MINIVKGKGLFIFSDPGGAKPVLSFIYNKKIKNYKIISDRKYNFFASRNLSYNEVKRVLGNLDNCSQSSWEKKYYTSIKDLVFLDTGNIKFKKILSNILKNSS